MRVVRKGERDGIQSRGIQAKLSHESVGCGDNDMSGRIDYQIEKYSFGAVEENQRLTHQWAEVAAECRLLQAGA
ncbi:hypothetical protein ACT2EE_25710, partial [Salmonella enterica subsp. enterica serovar Jukestown]